MSCWLLVTLSMNNNRLECVCLRQQIYFFVTHVYRRWALSDGDQLIKWRQHQNDAVKCAQLSHSIPSISTTETTIRWSMHFVCRKFYSTPCATDGQGRNRYYQTRVIYIAIRGFVSPCEESTTGKVTSKKLYQQWQYAKITFTKHWHRVLITEHFNSILKNRIVNSLRNSKYKYSQIL